jgi:hypothetical protein
LQNTVTPAGSIDTQGPQVFIPVDGERNQSAERTSRRTGIKSAASPLIRASRGGAELTSSQDRDGRLSKPLFFAMSSQRFSAP